MNSCLLFVCFFVVLHDSSYVVFVVMVQFSLPLQGKKTATVKRASESVYEDHKRVGVM